MHETTKRWIIRLAFLLACVLPTASVIAFAVRMRMPGYHRAFEQAVQAMLGARVAIAEVTHPQPYESHATEVRITDEESGICLFLANGITVRRTKLGHEVHIQCGTLNSHGIARIWAILHDRFLKLRENELGIVSIRCDELSLQSDSASQALFEIKGHLERQPCTHYTAAQIAATRPSEPACQLKLSFRSRHDSVPAAKLTVSRICEARDWKTLVSLDLGDHRLNVSSAFPAWAERVGPRAVVRGRFLGEYSGRHWSGSVNNLRCESMLGQQLLNGDRVPDALSGVAEISEFHAVFRDERLQEFRGTFQAVEGAIRRSFLDDLVRHLELTPHINHRPGNAAPKYHRIGLKFVGHKSGLVIMGDCPDAQEETVIMGEDIRLTSNGGRAISYQRLSGLLRRWGQPESVEWLLEELLPLPPPT
jgi:hypothetical protein